MRLAALTILLMCWMPRAMSAQTDTTFYSTRAPDWVVPVSIAGANMLLSGVTAGLAQELRGGSFRDGFTRGALGGLFIYAGKRVSVEGFDGAGLLGRQINAVGTSVVGNASEGVGSFDRLVLPVGVTRLYWQRKTRPNFQVKIDAVALGWTIYGIVEPELELNFGESVSAGTPVFQTNGKIIAFGDNRHAGGVVQAGVIFLSNVRPWGEEFLEKAYAHERVHTLQLDQVFTTWINPQDDRLLGFLPGGGTVNRYLDVNVSTELIDLMANFFDRHRDRPWELEAIYLTR